MREKKTRKRRFFFFFECLQTFSKGKESGYYYYSSSLVSCWLSGPFFHWLLSFVGKRFLFFSRFLKTEKNEDFFLLLLLLLVHRPLTITFKLEQADDGGQLNVVYPSNGILRLSCIHIHVYIYDVFLFLHAFYNINRKEISWIEYIRMNVLR